MTIRFARVSAAGIGGIVLLTGAASQAAAQRRHRHAGRRGQPAGLGLRSQEGALVAELLQIRGGPLNVHRPLSPDAVTVSSASSTDIMVLPSSTTEDGRTGNDVLTCPVFEDGRTVRRAVQPQRSPDDVSGKERVITISVVSSCLATRSVPSSSPADPQKEPRENPPRSETARPACRSRRMDHHSDK
jgi:hypothetical protein